MRKLALRGAIAVLMSGLLAYAPSTLLADGCTCSASCNGGYCECWTTSGSCDCACSPLGTPGCRCEAQ